MSGAGRIGSRKQIDLPPPKLLFGLGGLCFVANHLAAVFGSGVSTEGLSVGSLAVLLGVCGLPGRRFDAARSWVDRSGRRAIGSAVAGFAAALGLAEAVAWFGYGEHLFG